jgi:dihydrofolate reductase
MLISIVVATSTNNVIGKNGQLPWRLPDDLKHFKAITMGKPIIMGRLTWESIGRPLPGRQNIVISRNPDYVADDCDVVTSPAAALAVAGDVNEIMIIGGGRIYEMFLSQARRLYLTRVQADIDGDTFFPAIVEGEGIRDWCLVSRTAHAADDVNEYAHEFRVYERS